MEHNPERMKLAVDFGDGQQAEVEFPASNAVWVAAERGIEIADVWMKDVAGAVDLRVRILRLGNALEVSVDRGEQSARWWPSETVPRLLIALDRTHGVASAAASAGEAATHTEVELGKVSC